MRLVGTKEELLSELRAEASRRRAGVQPLGEKMTSRQLLAFAQGLEHAASMLEMREEPGTEVKAE